MGILRVFYGYSMGILWVLRITYLGDSGQGFSFKFTRKVRQGEVNFKAGFLYSQG